ncbi:uncharacterized protein Z518_00316 [Rhinocladiella mackenziei CBS 650.93]|uniref:Aldehyde dehydrogenase domain-containing protein n=1 Tax=Rhinocladiella mackenziei CBS 650.93 TaxID=1442369 RepID=A0A0D2G3P9_9EURO|nr:uncharacterized protein Z518_00316 [Rhinocladiella mackenziei CBS 650.93]KIX09237.1 hypothetical protein Z518_00316 [Rhinocladiella mackenziei CBS 650.93]
MHSKKIPLIIHGEDVFVSEADGGILFTPNPDIPDSNHWKAQGGTPDLCREAVESCSKAFEGWRKTAPTERRRFFNRLAQLLRVRRQELHSTIKEELQCSDTWASINVEDSIALAEQIAGLCTSGILSSTVPEVRAPGAHGVVFKEPLGVVLAIAPWNAPAILGLRSVAAAVAAGNCAVFKGSELSPRTHYFIAKLFKDAELPPGVVNFLVHRPQDAVEIFETLISHPAIRKCNFTGSTRVGRYVAMRAAHYLKPVLLELGGKNFAIVLNDADLESAAQMILEGAFLNTGQICMSTDIVLTTEESYPKLCAALEKAYTSLHTHATQVISIKSEERIQLLLKDAESKGASLFPQLSHNGGGLEPTIIKDLKREMAFWEEESFGPLVGIAKVKDVDEAVETVNQCNYGLSAAIFTQSNLKMMDLGRRLNCGAVHINGPTVHDEATLPHGGFRESGWGRFGGHWAFEEFLQTKTVIVNA